MPNLLKIAPKIGEYLTSLTDESLLRFFTERRLRKIAGIKDHAEQIRKFQELKKKAGIREEEIMIA